MIFGDVIQLQDIDEVKDYVYLGAPQEGGAVFLARVPDVITSKMIIDRQEKLLSNPQSGNNLRKLNSDLYFIVELTTKEFRNRIAYLGKTDWDETEMQKHCGTSSHLEEEDIRKIKHKILSASPSSVLPKLREIIERLPK